MPLRPTQGLYADVILLGWTEPFTYEAGSGTDYTFPAGTTFTVCVGIDAHDYDVLKVKTAHAADVEAFLVNLGERGVSVTIEYLPKSGTGRNARPAELLGLSRTVEVAAAASNGKAHKGHEGE